VALRDSPVQAATRRSVVSPRGEDVGGGDGGDDAPLGLGLELPFIVEEDFDYYPRVEYVSKGMQTGEGSVGGVLGREKKRGWRLGIQRVLRRLMGRIWRGKCV